jgi:hypothetical protein
LDGDHSLSYPGTNWAEGKTAPAEEYRKGHFIAAEIYLYYIVIFWPLLNLDADPQCSVCWRWHVVMILPGFLPLSQHGELSGPSG